MGFFNTVKKIFSDNPTPASPSTPQPQTQIQPQLQQQYQNKVLIVEDEILLANALEIKLKNSGFDVYKAPNGKVGLDMASAVKPDIILLDLLMPVMDGKSMLHNLRQTPGFKTTPVIILTNAGDIDNIRETTTYDNADAFLIKSNVTPDEIVQKINGILL